jgi:hypothetical protein
LAPLSDHWHQAQQQELLMSDYHQTDLLGLFTSQEDINTSTNDSTPASNYPSSHAIAEPSIQALKSAPQQQGQLDIFINPDDESGALNHADQITTGCTFSLNGGSKNGHYDQRFSSSLNSETITDDIIYQGWKVGPGTNDDQPSLFDQATVEPPLAIDSQAIINQVLEEFMPQIRAELKKRLLAAEQQSNSASKPK